MIVGIDLGTTNSLIAIWTDDGPVLIPNSLGEVLTPSCVSLDEDGSVLVGQAAKERLQTHPGQAASVFKRYMGSNKVLRLGSKEFRPEELSALVLRSLKEDAEAYTGETVKEAIITVPAYFSDAQRKATRAAGELAGLSVQRLLNEPTAAALAYGIHQRTDETRFLVFDLGGGTFDVSVLDLFEGVMEVRASAGDNFLGGEDFVIALMEKFFDINKVPQALRSDPHFLQILTARTEAAKRALGESPNVQLQLSYQEHKFEMTLDEALLEKVCAPLLSRLRTPVEKALRDANLRSGQLDNIVLAGGASRMPLVRRLVARMFGRIPACDINPDQVVALGAAVQAGLRAKHADLKEIVMTDVTPYSLGVDVAIQMANNTYSNGHFDPIIERNQPIPISRVKSYVPVSERQEIMEFNIYQGDARLAADNIRLGKIQIPIPRNGVGRRDVDVRFTYDVSGLLQIEATAQHTGEKVSLVIEENPGLLNAAEIAERLESLAELKIHPRDQQENRALMAKAERIYQQLRGEQREWLRWQVVNFEQILASQDPPRITDARRQFGEILQGIERDSYLSPSFDPNSLS